MSKERLDTFLEAIEKGEPLQEGRPPKIIFKKGDKVTIDPYRVNWREYDVRGLGDRFLALYKKVIEGKIVGVVTEIHPEEDNEPEYANIEWNQSNLDTLSIDTIELKKV